MFKARLSCRKICHFLFWCLLLSLLLNETAALADSEGTCGPSLTWHLSEKGILTISGTGSMSETDSWDKQKIRSIILEEGVTSISDSAFSQCAQLESVSFPDTLTEISARAFLNCPKLKNVSLPPALQSIGFSAFARCVSLTEISLPATLTRLDFSAFDECGALTQLNVDSNNSIYSSIDGILYDYACKILYLVPAGRTDTVMLPVTVTDLWGNPFESCSELKGIDVALDNPAFSADSGILYNQEKTELLQVPRGLSGVVSIPNGVSVLPVAAFSKCAGITEITLPGSISTVNTGTFSDCTALKSIHFSEGIATLGGSLFSGCDVLNNLSIPASVTSVDPRMMQDSSITRVEISANNATYESLDGLIYRKGGASLVSCPPARTGNIILPSSLKSIEPFAFYRSHLFFIRVPESVSSIGLGAFSSNQIQILVLMNPSTEIVAQEAHREYPLLREEAGQVARGRLYSWADSTAKAHSDSFSVPFSPIDRFEGEWLSAGGTWYYLTPGLSLASGWQEIGGEWYYFTDSGAMATGWQQIGGSWYYLTDSGAMADPGWLNLGGSWYYLTDSGAMVTGWYSLKDTWYWFDNSGVMASGWQKISGRWYLFATSGAMLTGWQHSNGTWYYLRSSGAMASGWLDLSGSWYYFDGSGAMLTGWQEINGQWELFDASGVWQYTWDGK